MKLLGNRILVKPFKGNDKTDKGILIPLSMIKNKQKGIICHISDGYYNHKGEWLSIEVKVGDIIYFPKAVETNTIEINKEIYYLMSDNEVYCILDNEKIN